MLDAPATPRRPAASLAVDLPARRAFEPRALQRGALLGLARAARLARATLLATVALGWLGWRSVAVAAGALLPRWVARPAPGLFLAGIVVVASLGNGWTADPAGRSEAPRSGAPILMGRGGSTAPDRPVVLMPWEEPAVEAAAGPYLADGTLLKPVLLEAALHGLASAAITLYTVQRGDTLTGIASRFGVSMMTLWWANDLSSKDVLRVGQKLRVPPVTGLLYTVREGDTIESIAALTKGDAQEIRRFNGLDSGTLLIGMLLVIPDGVGEPIPTAVPTTRPATTAAPVVKPIATMVGVASWMYPDGTAARLPIGTLLRICGDGGCIQRRVTSWGPSRLDRIIDLNYRDFPTVCGCSLGTGLAVVRVDILPD